jgi:hypothetical protein
MSKSSKFSNFEIFQPVENMNPIVRHQQYAYNGRMFIPPNKETFDTTSDVDSTVYGDNGDNSNNNINGDNSYNAITGLTQVYQSRFDQKGLIPSLEPNETIKPYDLYKNSNSPQNTGVDIISNIVVPNAVSRTFFSNDNMERIQRQIINNVYTQSKKQISKQSYQELQIIMKSIYLQYSRNLPNNIEQQVLTLNKYVVDECVSIIIPNVIQYNKYITEITSPIPVPPRSINVSNKGDKSLPGPGTQF